MVKGHCTRQEVLFSVCGHLTRGVKHTDRADGSVCPQHMEDVREPGWHHTITGERYVAEALAQIDKCRPPVNLEYHIQRQKCPWCHSVSEGRGLPCFMERIRSGPGVDQLDAATIGQRLELFERIIWGDKPLTRAAFFWMVAGYQKIEYAMGIPVDEGTLVYSPYGRDCEIIHMETDNSGACQLNIPGCHCIVWIGQVKQRFATGNFSCPDCFARIPGDVLVAPEFDGKVGTLGLNIENLDERELQFARNHGRIDAENAKIAAEIEQGLEEAFA